MGRSDIIATCGRQWPSSVRGRLSSRWPWGEAARCLQAGQRLPAAEKALATVFGEDTQAVVENVTRPRADERRPEEAPGSKAAPPAKPEIEEVPRTGRGESI